MNKAWWEKMVKEKCGFTVPWLDLDPAAVKKYAQGKLARAPKHLNEIFPACVLENVKDKDVLCLASGGGQQSAVFGILGARVTVVDIAEGQLAGDKKAAAHYGYHVTTNQGDMSDLSMLKKNSFDLVYQAPSMAYIPDVKKVYAEVARVLRQGGLYRADAMNPLAQFIDETSWDGTGYRVSIPYSVKEKKRARDKGVIEFRHTLEDAFNGLLECGFIIEYVQEAPPDLYQNGTPKPGTWEHSELYLPGMFTILARKK
ncbi:MAG: class I SAM-dependent methyltransferase [Patescibacteria group bacterium]